VEEPAEAVTSGDRTQGRKGARTTFLAPFRLCVVAWSLAAAPALQAQKQSWEPPPPPPEAWRGLIGEYGPDSVTRVMILERGGKLVARFDSAQEVTLEEVSKDRWRGRGTKGPRELRFQRNAAAAVTGVAVGQSTWPRRALGPEDGSVFRITPVRPIAELRREALNAMPPTESGSLRAGELMELARLDPSIKLDIRYATPRNFLGTPVYTEARAFLQVPAAIALVRAHRMLAPQGYGLLIHDAYRPWFVTRMFWDATPAAMREFVADPKTGSRHNRGAAVDLTLYHLRTGLPVEMPGVYDEFSRRSYPDYPGGTSRQRWYRDLLRQTMETQGFTVFGTEWWHFDHKDWQLYRIANTPFEMLFR
jgi:D-alanyl-D-alanine dipeptidase